tara:strand:- start:8410 stop:9807 length:1398 start_codon:yes stop_codon:yes gene_type:complete
MNNEFEVNYSKYIQRLYRKQDTELSNDNNQVPHKYSVLEREDFTKYETYSIDPEGCEDADDAFSVFEENNSLFLAIHIADPTEYINIESQVWKNIMNNVVTQYPSNQKPLHMMPAIIMEKSSLMDNKYGNIKYAITILVKLNINTYLPENIKLLFTKIKSKKENALNYKKASENAFINNDIFRALQIGYVLQNIRSSKTVGVKLNEVSHSYPIYKNNIAFLYKDNEYEIKMKQMIAEFAILANSFVGEYLQLNLEGKGIFRTCVAKEWLGDKYNLKGDELLNEIISNGIKAEYLSNKASHDLVGAPEYTHFTSPIRRLSDCVCHYLLKYIYLKTKVPTLLIPFSEKELENISNICLNTTRKMKQIQYKDNKFRLTQSMYNLLFVSDNLNLTFYITGYTGLFLNAIICKINHHDVYLSYTLKTKICNLKIDNKKMYTISVHKITCPEMYDEGSIPELDIEILSLAT